MEYSLIYSNFFYSILSKDSGFKDVKLFFYSRESKSYMDDSLFSYSEWPIYD